MKAFAVLGGTFDPVHCGHLRIAIEVRERLALDEVRLMPAPFPRLRDRPSANPQQRLEMLGVAVRDVDAMRVEPLELESARGEQRTRTVDTLRTLRADNPDASIGFIIGADAFARLDEWHEYEALTTLAHLVVVGRAGSALPSMGPVARLLTAHRPPPGASMRDTTCGHIFEVETPLLDISASQIRRYISNGRSIDFLLPPAVQEVIERDHTYQHAT